MYIITSKTRAKMRRNPKDRQKIKQEQHYYYQEQGLTKIAPLKGQSDDQMFDDVKKAGNFIKDSLLAQQEEKIKKLKQKNKEKILPIKITEKKYFAQKEKLAKLESEKRKITLN